MKYSKAEGKTYSWDILIPKKLEKGDRGLHPVDYVSRFPTKALVHIIGRSPHGIQEDLAKNYDRAIEKISTSTFCSVKYRNQAIISVSCWGKPGCVNEPHSRKQFEKMITTREPHLSENQFKKQLKTMVDAYEPHPLELLDGMKRTYPWQSLLNNVLIIEKLP